MKVSRPEFADRSALSIRPVATASDLTCFLRLPEDLYHGIPGFIAPLELDRRALLDPAKASFFQRGEAQYWLAYRNGRPVGRISAQIDHLQPPQAFAGAGLFGCLDAIDDAEVVAELLIAARDWLLARGRRSMAGPFSLTINQEPGLLVAGQTEPPLSMVAWHPSYLEQHLLSAGFSPSKDLHYWRLEGFDTLESATRGRTRSPHLPQGYSIRGLNMRALAQDLDAIRLVYNDAWQDNWGFVPLHAAEVAAISRELKPFFRPEFGLLIEHEGQAVGVGLVLPNLLEITADLGPRPSPLGWARLAYRALTHRFASGSVILLGVSARYRHSIMGAVMAMTMVEQVSQRLSSYKSASAWLEAGWILEDNTALIKIISRYEFKPVRTLRLFEKQISNG